MTYDFVIRDYPLKKELFLTDATDPLLRVDKEYNYLKFN
jgi:hypothetical protein